MIELKVATVSGAGSGIGKASARRLALLGAMAVVADILLAASEKIAAAAIASLAQHLTKPIDTARAITCGADDRRPKLPIGGGDGANFTGISRLREIAAGGHVLGSGFIPRERCIAPSMNPARAAGSKSRKGRPHGRSSASREWLHL